VAADCCSCSEGCPPAHCLAPHHPHCARSLKQRAGRGWHIPKPGFNTSAAEDNETLPMGLHRGPHGQGGSETTAEPSHHSAWVDGRRCFPNHLDPSQHFHARPDCRSGLPVNLPKAEPRSSPGSIVGRGRNCRAGTADSTCILNHVHKVGLASRNSNYS